MSKMAFNPTNWANGANKRYFEEKKLIEKNFFYLYIYIIGRNDILTEEQKKEQQKVIKSLTKKAGKFFDTKQWLKEGRNNNEKTNKTKIEETVRKRT